MEGRQLDATISDYGFDDFRWIAGEDIDVRHWVRFVCQFKCAGYGISAVCPPNLPGVGECRAFLSEYSRVAVLRKQIVDCHMAGSAALLSDVDENLMALERRLFLDGYPKVMALPMTVCYRCERCAGSPRQCRDKEWSRPNPEALAVDVFATVHKLGYPAEVLAEPTQWQNRYAFLLVE